MMQRLHLAVSPDLSRFALAHGASTIRLWRAPRRRYHEDAPIAQAPCGLELETGRSGLLGLGWLPSGVLVCAHAEGRVQAWGVRDTGRSAAWEARAADIKALPEQGIAAWPRGRAPIVGQGLEATLLWELDLRGRVACCAVRQTSQGLELALGSAQGAVYVVRVARALAPTLEPLGAHGAGLVKLCWADDGAMLAAAGRDHLLSLWRPGKRTYRPWRRLDESSAEISALRFSRSGRYLVSGSIDYSISLWDLLAKKPLRAISHDHQGWIGDLAWADDERVIAAASWDKTVGLFRAGDLTPLYCVDLHEDYVSQTCFVPDSTYLLSASYDRSIAVWDWRNAELVSVLKGHADWIQTLSWLGQGLFVSAAADRTLRVWSINTLCCELELGSPASATRQAQAPSVALFEVGRSSGFHNARLRPEGHALADVSEVARAAVERAQHHELGDDISLFMADASVLPGVTSPAPPGDGAVFLTSLSEPEAAPSPYVLEDVRLSSRVLEIMPEAMASWLHESSISEGISEHAAPRLRAPTEAQLSLDAGEDDDALRWKPPGELFAGAWDEASGLLQLPGPPAEEEDPRNVTQGPFSAGELTYARSARDSSAADEDDEDDEDDEPTQHTSHLSGWGGYADPEEVPLPPTSLAPAALPAIASVEADDAADGEASEQSEQSEQSEEANERTSNLGDWSDIADDFDAIIMPSEAQPRPPEAPAQQGLTRNGSLTPLGLPRMPEDEPAAPSISAAPMQELEEEREPTRQISRRDLRALLRERLNDEATPTPDPAGASAELVGLERHSEPRIKPQLEGAEEMSGAWITRPARRPSGQPHHTPRQEAPTRATQPRPMPQLEERTSPGVAPEAPVGGTLTGHVPVLSLRRQAAHDELGCFELNAAEIWHMRVKERKAAMKIFRRRSGAASSFERVDRAQTQLGEVRQVRYSAEGRFFVAAGERGFEIWTSAPTRLGAVTLSEGKLNVIALTPDGRAIIGADSLGRLHIWLLPQQIEALAPGGETIGRASLRGHQGPVPDLALDSLGRYALTASHDGSARLWDLERGEVSAVLWHPNTRVHAVTFGPDGPITASQDGMLRFWSREGSVQGLVGGIGATTRAIHARRQDLILISQRGPVHLYRDRHHHQPLEALANSVDLSFAPDGALATAHEDGVVALYHSEQDLTPAQRFELGEPARCVCLDSALLLAGTRSGAIELFKRR